MSDPRCPTDGLFEHDIPADPELVAAGWVRRYLADPIRAREATELYGRLGYEVKAQKLTAADFGPNCEGCPASACVSYVMIYTREANGRGRP